MQPSVKTLRHDLRGHLNSIMLCASVLPITSEKAELVQFLDEILIAADRATSVLDQIDALPPEAFADEEPASP